MSFWDHLDDLRKVLFKMLAVFFGAAIVLFCFKTFLFDQVIFAPADNDFYLYRLLGTEISLGNFQNIEISSQFFVHLKVTLLCALVLTFPFLMYQIWRFVAPALYENEKKAIRGAFAFASILFYAGVLLAYFVIFPLMLNFFADYQISTRVENHFSLSAYTSMLLTTSLMFGLVFEFPTLIAVASKMGLVTKDGLKTYRRHALCIIMVLAAIITPSGDPFTLVICTVPLYMLYEFSILICKDNDLEEELIEEEV